MSSLFRPAAEAAYGRDDIGRTLEVGDRWVPTIYHAVVMLLLGALAFVCLVPVNEYATGTGFVRISGSQPVTSTAAGPIARMAVGVGDRVAKGDVVVELDGRIERAELERLQEQFDGAWTRVLRDPVDVAARASLPPLLPLLGRARAALEARVFRAPIDGVVTDVRGNLGGHVEIGDTLFVVEPDDATVEVVALLPGAFRPQLDVGKHARFAVDGSDSPQPVRLRDISADLVGATEVKRILGPALADGAPFSGTSVTLVAAVDARTYPADGRANRYYQGMLGELEVRLERKPILFLLLPRLRRLVYGDE